MFPDYYLNCFKIRLIKYLEILNMLKWLKTVFKSPEVVIDTRIVSVTPIAYEKIDNISNVVPSRKEIAASLLDGEKFYEAEVIYRELVQADKADVDAIIMLGFALKEQGKNSAATEQLKNAAKLTPNNFDVHYMLASLASVNGNFQEASVHFNKVLALNPTFELAYRDYSYLLAKNNEFDKAHDIVNCALIQFPNEADFDLIKGDIFKRQNLFDDAISSYKNAIAKRREFAYAYVQLCILMESKGNLDEALTAIDIAVNITPSNSSTLLIQGKILMLLERRIDALASFDRVLTLDPDCIDAIANTGTLLHLEDRESEALTFYNRALSLCTDLPVVWLNKSVIAFNNFRNFEESISFAKKALELEPNSVDALHQLGIGFAETGRLEDAMTQFSKALTLNPDHVLTLFDRAKVFQKLEKHEDALKSLHRALEIDPTFAKAHFDESFSRLALGELEIGWEKYEWRWKCKPFTDWKRKFPAPIWLGKEPLKGKVILLHGEQGFGDTIQFARYVELVAALDAKVILEVQPALKSLFKNFAGAHQILAEGEVLPSFDYYCPLPSLPRAFNTGLESVPKKKTYFEVKNLAPDSLVKWETRIGNRKKFKVGVVWSGSLVHQNDKNRSIPLSQFAKIFVDNVQFFSLQKEVRPSDRSELDAQVRVTHLGNDLTDFVETAAVISILDLVITVDTSVAHLAACLGKPVWVLIPFNPDWRWLLNRSDNPWYETVKLFRQTKIGDWTPVLDSVAVNLSSCHHEFIKSAQNK